MVLVARQNDNADAEVTSWNDGELASLYLTDNIISICTKPLCHSLDVKASLMRPMHSGGCSSSC